MLQDISPPPWTGRPAWYTPTSGPATPSVGGCSGTKTIGAPSGRSARRPFGWWSSPVAHQRPLGQAPPSRSSKMAVSSALGVSQNRPIYKSISTIAITEAIIPSYLSPYKPGSPMKSQRISNNQHTNQDHRDSTQPVTCYITVHKYFSYIRVRIIITNQV